jgi:hypothetical protein
MSHARGDSLFAEQASRKKNPVFAACKGDARIEIFIRPR